MAAMLAAVVGGCWFDGHAANRIFARHVLSSLHLSRSARSE
jgi:hypothetical protein